MTLRIRFAFAALCVCAVLTLGLSIVKADISNPHPTPPTNSITHAMLQAGIVTDSNVQAGAGIQSNKISGGNGDGTIPFSDFGKLSTSTNFTYATSTNKLTVKLGILVASSTCLGSYCQTWPTTDGVSGQALTTNGSGTFGFTTLAASKLTATIPAGEAINSGDVVTLGIYSPSGAVAGVGNAAQQAINSNIYFLRSFSSGVTVQEMGSTTGEIAVSGAGGSVTGNFIGVVFTDSAGTPSTLLCTGTTIPYTDPNNTNTVHTSTFTNGCPLALNTTYWVGYEITSPSDTTHTQFGGPASGAGYAISTNGSGWSTPSNGVKIGYGYSATSVGNVYEASAAVANFRNTGAIGLAESTVTAGQNVTVDISGLSTATTTVSSSVSYFLANANGQISTSAGSQSHKIGIGAGSSGFIVRIDNP